MSRPEEDGLFVGSRHFDAVGFDRRIVLESVVNDPAVEGAEGRQFHNIAPPTDLLGGFLRLLDQIILGLHAVTADIHRDLGGFWILVEEQSVREILKLAEGLPLASDQAPGIVGFDFEQQSVIQAQFFDGGIESKVLEELFQNGFRLWGHKRVRSVRPSVGALRRLRACFKIPWSPVFAEKALKVVSFVSALLQPARLASNRASSIGFLDRRPS